MADATCTPSGKLNGVSTVLSAFARGVEFDMGTIAFGVYTSNGVALGSIGIDDPTHVFVQADGYSFSWDATNQLLKAYWTGASTSAALAEVTNLTDMAAVTAAPYIAFKFPA